MEISALTRSAVKRNHAIIASDGYINSVVPGWNNCTVNVIINEAMGANFCQTLITAKQNCKLTGTTEISQIFFYIIEGGCQTTANNQTKQLIKGQYVYIPIGSTYLFEYFSEHSKF